MCVSYLINQLQALPFTSPVIVTLNPSHEPAPDKVLGRYAYEHPCSIWRPWTRNRACPIFKAANGRGSQAPGPAMGFTRTA